MHKLEKMKPVALLLLRIALGTIFIYHGALKLFRETQHYYEFFGRLGFPPYFSYLAGVIEFFGGSLLLVGLFTRVAGLLIAGEMAVALWKVHLAKGVMAVNEYEFPLALATAAFALAAAGPGVVSLDWAIFKDKA